MRLAPVLAKICGLALICGLSLPACSLYFEQDPGDGGDGPSTCELRSANDFVPGFPFQFPDYEQVVWPLTQRGCGVPGCHDATDGFSSGFEVWPRDGDPCSVIWSFNALYDHSDYLISPDNSVVLVALDGRMPTHPVQPGAGSSDYVAIYNFIRDAWLQFSGGDNSKYFDFFVFQADIQPMLDDASCAASNCHHFSTGYTGFLLYPQPAWDSAEMIENFDMVTSFVDLDVWPDETRLFNAATDWHGTVVNDTAKLRRWLTDAFENRNDIGD